MPPPIHAENTHADASWSAFRHALRLGQPRAQLRLLATVTSLVSVAGRSLAPEIRAEACERIVASLDARLRAQSIRSPGELLHALDGELARYLSREALEGLAPSAALLARLGESLSALGQGPQQALAAYYGDRASVGPGDADARRLALAALRGHLALDVR